MTRISKFFDDFVFIPTFLFIFPALTILFMIFGLPVLFVAIQVLIVSIKIVVALISFYIYTETTIFFYKKARAVYPLTSLGMRHQMIILS